MRLLPSSAFATWGRASFSKRHTAERRVAAKLQKTDVVYSNYRNTGDLVFLRTGVLAPSNANTIPYEKVRLEDLPKGSYVYLNSDKTDSLAKSYHYKNPPLADHPPANWKKIWSMGHSSLYVVNGGQEPKK